MDYVSIEDKDSYLVDWYGEELANKYVDVLNKRIKLQNELFKRLKSEEVLLEFKDKLNKILNLNLEYRFVFEDKYDWVKFESVENLSTMFPVLNFAWNNFKVCSWGSILLPIRYKSYDTYGRELPENIDYENPFIGDVQLCMQLEYKYNGWTTGSNGTTFGYAYYTLDNGWEIILDKDEFEFEE